MFFKHIVIMIDKIISPNLNKYKFNIKYIFIRELKHSFIYGK